MTKFIIKRKDFIKGCSKERQLEEMLFERDGKKGGREGGRGVKERLEWKEKNFKNKNQLKCGSFFFFYCLSSVSESLRTQCSYPILASSSSSFSFKYPLQPYLEFFGFLNWRRLSIKIRLVRAFVLSSSAIAESWNFVNLDICLKGRAVSFLSLLFIFDLFLGRHYIIIFMKFEITN